VRVGRVERAKLDEVIIGTGTLSAHDRAVLSVKVAGRLAAMFVDLGTPVKKGDVVAQIDKTDFLMRREQTAAALAQARARLGVNLSGAEDEVKPENVSVAKEASAVLTEATKTRERIKSLHEQGIVAQADVESTESQYQVASMKYEEALQEAKTRLAMLAQRMAELHLAEQELSDSTIRASFDGVIESRMASPGEFLNTGSPVATLVRVDPVRLRVEIPEKDAPKIQEGQTVRYTVVGDEQIYTSSLARLSPVITGDNRMFIAEADFENKNGRLRPGGFGRVEIVANSEATALLAPKEALVSFAGIEKLFMIENGKIVEKEVTSGRILKDRVEIISGAKEGDLVVLEPGNLKGGDPVLTANAEEKKPQT
jgi:RND family efflux transporter MFP subunit